MPRHNKIFFVTGIICLTGIAGFYSCKKSNDTGSGVDPLAALNLPSAPV